MKRGIIPFTQGVHETGRGCWAYLQPDGGWGWSNTGLVVDGDRSLLVDTLFDLRSTQAMLDEMRAAVPAAREIDTVVNTHADGDHTYGNQLLAGAEIVGEVTLAEDLAKMPPSQMQAMNANYEARGAGGRFFYEMMGKRYDFSDIALTLPTRTFQGQLSLKVGDKDVDLVHVGPAHSRSDTLVHSRADRTVFTGDILFMNVHPAIWAGPMQNWLKACDLILSWDVDVVVPGHGPVTDKSGVRTFRAYLEYLVTEARKRFDAGMGYYEAACDISLDPYADWISPERIVSNVAFLFQEFGAPPPPRTEVSDNLARYHAERCRGHDHR
jgi:glyoxylase-like metal-dependent hydrolase (beta-lactamase superfamily II)